jgi:hypothetical protein
VWHCFKPKLVACKYYTEQYYGCEICREHPPERLIKEMKIHYIMEKYGIREEIGLES